MTISSIKTVADLHDYLASLYDRAALTSWGLRILAPLSRWLNASAEVIYSDDAQAVLQRCANDPRFKSLDDQRYGQQRLFIFFGPYTYA